MRSWKSPTPNVAVLPEIYSTTDSSSPGLALFDTLPCTTGPGGGIDEFIPAWEQGDILRSREDSLNLFIPFFTWGRTTSAPRIPLATVVLSARHQRRSADDPATIPVSQLIARIRSSLSLQVKELAEILAVERPTIYAWLDSKSTPRLQNRRRLAKLYALAKRWDALSNQPLGKSLHEIGADNRSVFDLLLETELCELHIAERFRAIAAGRRETTRSTPRRKSIAQLAQEHGIDLDKISDQGDQIDILTGKRVALDE